jgi:hypothetical protein
MERSQQVGMLLMAGASLQALIMLIGVLRRSYVVIALPVMAATGLACALAFWVGWTMMNTEPDLAELEQQDAVPAAV